MGFLKIVWVSVLLSIACYGLWIDHETAISPSNLEFAFYLSSLLGILLSSLSLYSPNVPYWYHLARIVVAYLTWRISFFPIMVLSGFVATWGEYLSSNLTGYSSVYPFFLSSIVLMNAAALWVAETILAVVLMTWHKPQTNAHTSTHSVALLGLPMAVLAVMVSFTQPMDWHSIPDTSWVDNKPMPQPAVPEFNPYESAMETDGLSIQHRVLFKAASLTYDWIPEQTNWSQIVKGTLEREFLTTNNVSTSFCSKIHYRAFVTAQPFIKREKAESLF